MGCLLDTNILLRVIDRQHAACKLVRKAIEKLRSDDHNLFVAPQNLVEFWVVATRPISSNGLGLTPNQTEALITRFRTVFLLLVERRDSYEIWERLAVAHAVCGKQAHDAKLAAVIQAHGIESILTFNGADFERYPHILVLHPEGVVKGA